VPHEAEKLVYRGAEQALLPESNGKEAVVGKEILPGTGVRLSNISCSS
jgi:hypothetical protein